MLALPHPPGIRFSLPPGALKVDNIGPKPDANANKKPKDKD